MTQTELFLLALIRKSLFGTGVLPDTKIEYPVLFEIANRHAVVPFAYDGLQKFSVEIADAEIANRMRSIVLSSAISNERLMNEQKKILAFLSEAKIPTVILKGTTVSVLYPDPQMRTLGDIDVLVPADRSREAVTTAEKSGFKVIPEDHDFHFELHNGRVSLEIHFSASKTPDNEAGRFIDSYMNNLWSEICEKSIGRNVFPALDETRQALSLLLHCQRHLLHTGGIGLRQLIDWEMFINSVDEKCYLEKIRPVLTRGGLSILSDVLTKICVSYCGLDVSKVSWCAKTDAKTAALMLEDILGHGNQRGNDDDRSASNIFLESDDQTKLDRSVLSSAVFHFNEKARREFPITVKLPFLLPFFWIYFPICYWVRSLSGKRKKRSASNLLTIANKRKKLYRKLNIFK